MAYGYFLAEVMPALDASACAHTIVTKLVGLILAGMLIVLIMQMRQDVANKIRGDASRTIGQVRERVAEVTAIIIDDTELMRAVVRPALEHIDIVVIGEAENGRDGVDLTILIMLDILMPDMNGYLALEEMIRRLHEPFVIMMTSVDDEEVIDACRLAGAQDYIQKSVPMPEIVERLRRHADFLKKN